MILPALVACAMVGLTAVAAAAFEGRRTFHKDAVLLSVEGGYGEQDNITKFDDDPGLEFWHAGARLSLLPFEPIGLGPLSGTLETGLVRTTSATSIGSRRTSPASGRPSATTS